MEEIPSYCSLGEAIWAHVTSVNPDYGLEDTVIKKFTNILYMDKQALVGRWLDENRRNGGEYGLRINIETHGKESALVASVSGLLLLKGADLYFP
jgi:hypothetical protein